MRSTAFDRPVSSVFHGKRSEALRHNREPRHSGSSFSSESRSETHKPGRTIQALRSCVRTSCYSVYLRGDERWTPPSHSEQLKHILRNPFGMEPVVARDLYRSIYDGPPHGGVGVTHASCQTFPVNRPSGGSVINEYAVWKL